MIGRPPRSTLTATLLPATTLFRSQPLEAVLAAHPRYAATLRPLLQTSSALGDDARPVPDPVRLEQHYSAVRSALRDARRKLDDKHRPWRSEEHTSELQSLLRISYAVFCLIKKKKTENTTPNN